MKLSPTVPLALTLAAGMALAAAAQTTPGSSDQKSTATELKSTAVKPMTGSTQTEPGMNGGQATSSAPMMSSTTNGIEPKSQIGIEQKSQSTAEMKTPRHRVKHTAHLRVTHPQRLVQMRTEQRTAMSSARERGPMTQAANLSPDQIQQAQQQLQAAGLYNGPTDGMMDPDTRAALARFQQQNGLRRTDSLDQQTLARLNSGQTTTGFGSSAPTTNQAPPASAGGNTTGQPAK
jgi:hypothetical protein